MATSTLNDSGHLVRHIERRSNAGWRGAAVGDVVWIHSLSANGSIVSEPHRVLPDGGLTASALRFEGDRPRAALRAGAAHERADRDGGGVMAQPITWKELRDAVAALHEGLLGARDQANEAVWNPPDDRRLDRIYVDAYADLRFEVDGLAHRAEVLVERMAEAAAPARPLEAVLADIEAEGHRTVAIRYSVTLGYWLCETDTGAERWVGDDVAEWEAWCTSVERGESRGGTATEAAQARLAQVRDLHAEKAANPLASLNLTPAQVRENIEEALAAPPPVAAADAVERDQARASETDGGEEGA